MLALLFAAILHLKNSFFGKELQELRQEAAPLVNTSQGLLRGRRVEDGEEFLGIRYAARPARFELSELSTAQWEGVYEVMIMVMMMMMTAMMITIMTMMMVMMMIIIIIMSSEHEEEEEEEDVKDPR
eukprot:s2209_g4.t1